MNILHRLVADNINSIYILLYFYWSVINFVCNYFVLKTNIINKTSYERHLFISLFMLFLL
jgi:hypothetical protein